MFLLTIYCHYYYFFFLFSNFEVVFFYVCNVLPGNLWYFLCFLEFLYRGVVLSCLQPNWCNPSGYWGWWWQRISLEDWPRRLGFWASRYFHDSRFTHGLISFHLGLCCCTIIGKIKICYLQFIEYPNDFVIIKFVQVMKNLYLV